MERVDQADAEWLFRRLCPLYDPADDGMLVSPFMGFRGQFQDLPLERQSGNLVQEGKSASLPSARGQE